MLAQLVGPVDVPAAAVLIAIAIGLMVSCTTFLTVYTSRDKRLQDFEIAKMKLAHDSQLNMANANANHETAMARIATEKDVQFARIEHGMIDVKVARGDYADDDRG